MSTTTVNRAEMVAALRRASGGLTTKAARGLAHDAFDTLWQGEGLMTRTEAYRWLAKAMGIPKVDAHMEQFDVEQCLRVVRLVKGKKQ